MLGALTVRGRCLLAAGVAVILSGLVLSERDLLRIGIGLVVLPLVTTLITARARFRLRCERRIEPTRVPAGGSADIVLTIENIARVPTGLLLLEDTVPYRLAGRPRAAADRLGPHRQVSVGYRVSSTLRGRYPVGPLTVRLVDPFGLSELTRSFSSVDTLVVTPVVTELLTLVLRGERPGSGHSAVRSISTQGEDDATTREYRRGDDLRRIHWRSTARRGQLTVRREEQPSHTRATVLLDTRGRSHNDAAGESLEWAVAAAASIAVHLARRGFGVRVLTDRGELLGETTGAEEAFIPTVLDALAAVEPSPARSLDDGLVDVRATTGGAMLVVVGALVDPEDIDALVRAGTATDVALAILMDPQARADQSRDRPDPTVARTLLARAGWRTTTARPGHPVELAWAALGEGTESGTHDGADYQVDITGQPAATTGQR